ncbi:hypothetical protein AQS8620_03018 [Aquimixticola soesokkakensis]|uniref:Glutathione S-transferase n=1 Tax=Aquimixticola soesokkakensis TaxID=1519096 RepID=A0A1Y5TJ47_9RHOB|nr:glutathione S-transferase [Aquimixticola soesokkakensis]SLN65375.1 hypothetical protein AQS8620_03018 [Aquimixticola soesokkakensis]
MITFYHAPYSRSTNVLALLLAMEKLEAVDLRLVDVCRQDGTGQRDPANPHPEAKVPYLVVDGLGMRERTAMFHFLPEVFDSPLGRRLGDPDYPAYLSWLAYYGNVVEPVLVGQFGGFAQNPALLSAFRGAPEIAQNLRSALAQGPFLLGDEYCAADLLLSSPFLFFPDFTPDDDLIRAWVARCGAMPWVAEAAAHDEAALAARAQLPA